MSGAQDTVQTAAHDAQPASSTASNASNAAVAGSTMPTGAPSASSSSASSSHSNNTGKSGNAALAADALDYFSETAAKLGTGASSGVMIQSPDGRPAGIFFHPRTQQSAAASSSLSSSSSSAGGASASLTNNNLTASTNADLNPLQSGSEGGSAAAGTNTISPIPTHLASGADSGTASSNAAGTSSNTRTLQSRSNSALQEHLPLSRSQSSLAVPLRAGAEASSSPSGPASPASNASSPSLLETTTGLNTANGNIFTPQVGLHSILSRHQTPTATPLQFKRGDTSVPVINVPLNNLKEMNTAAGLQHQAAAGTVAGSEHHLSPLEEKVAASNSLPPTVKGDRAEKDDAQPRSPVELSEAEMNSMSNFSLLTSGGKNTSNVQRQSRKSFGAIDGGGATGAGRQTFGFTHASNTAARPSAQPQSGLLIGAGFSQPRRKGKLGPKSAATSIEVLPPIKVLIVEDNPINVKILSTFLKQRKIKFGVARDGREAVKEWETGGYHLILMDIQLPVMDGIEATKEIRRLEQQANIGPVPTASTPSLASNEQRSGKELGASDDLAPMENTKSTGATSPSIMLQNSLRASVIIVALTASVLNSDRVAALAAGCNDFLNKPVDLRWLERKVIEWGSMQYLISFREWPPSDVAAAAASARGSTSMQGGRKTLRRTYLSPTHSEVLRSEGLVDRGFGTGPDQLARELAGKLYIGGKKGRMESLAGAATQTAK